MWHFSLLPRRSPWLGLGLLLAFVTVGAFLGQLVGTQLAFINPKSMASTDLSLPTRGALLILQAATTVSAFIVAPLLYLCLFESRTEQLPLPWGRSYVTLLLLTLGLVLAAMVANIWLVYWNMTIKFPAWLHGFETWAQAQEATIRHISNRLTTFHSLQDLGTAIIIIGVIPAVGEELLFRGIIQHLCHQITHNIHSAIIISALAFSAIHLQFYGFVPRFLLGALFGYIYWWTKDLFFPIAAHFFNNALTLILLFLHQQGHIALDVTKPVALPIALFPLAILIVAILSHYLKHFSKKSHL